mmetsp:Transcript_49207/g.100476  ORF Transcript_49207/g.100476 Transcript_49207/m.100476 type:complete len:210 (+) Transcript_49207:174-803(+)
MTPFRISVGALLCAVSLHCASASIHQEKLSLTPASSILRLPADDQKARLALPSVSCGTSNLLSCRGMILTPTSTLRLRGGAKSKNHTNHNQNKKAHKNGIKRVKTHRYSSMKERDVKVWRNERYARKGSMRVYKQRLDEKKATDRGRNPYSDKHQGKGTAERMRRRRVRTNGMEDEEEDERELYRSPSSLASSEGSEGSEGSEEGETEE